MTVQKVADIMGVVLSQLCLVHCLFLPLLIALMPTFFSHSHHHHGSEGSFHLIALLVTTPVVIFAMWQGLSRHGSTRPSALAYSALAILWAVFFAEEMVGHDLVAAFNVTGGFLMAWAHWQNWTLSRVSCRCRASHA